MFAGRIQGTMALTEPHAGSSLADLTTAARPTDEGHYLITGTKIFISAGDHDAVDNVVHLLLARIQGAPPGVKGISLFLVPKLREGDDGKSVSNDVAVAGVYHKLGYRGAPITQLQFGENGDCRGYLVGREHQGLACMFQMMNEARIGVGLGATAIGSAAYYAALQYCRERPQGRKPGVKDPCAPQVPLIEHADVKRMLLFQRAIMEGSLSLALQCGKYEDVLRSGDGPARERAHLLLEALTPAAKSYPSEMCIHTVSAGLQCLGGYGYCDEFPLEQFYRDARIHPIHEGTTGIQALDLLGRKMTAAHGAAAHAFAEEVAACARDARIIPELDGYAQCLTDAVDLLGKVFHSLAEFAVKGETEVFCADAVLFLEMFGITAVAWQWLLQGIAAHEGLRAHPGETDVDFYRGKLLTMRYFFHYELPKTAALAKRLMETDGLTVHAADRDFRD
jgi:butyryl-CoA dehydrogenase